MDFKRYLEENARRIDEELDIILSDFLNETKKTNIKLLPFALGLINSCRGGKRIRGTLVKLGYELGRGGKWEMGSGKIEVGDGILKIAAALEILHTALLIHDDIMDKSPTRRGQPALYEALGGGHYGISQAISLGDIGLYLPIKIISEANFLGEYRLKALSFLSQTLVNTGWGQVLDVEGVREDRDFINLFKTAKYTIAGPLQLGAILAGADEQLIRVLGEFGENLGIAFQIHDDILDGETNSLDYSRQDEVKYVLRAKSIIPKITKDKEQAKLLTEMADFLVERIS